MLSRRQILALAAVILVYAWIWVGMIILRSPVVTMLVYYFGICFPAGFLLCKSSPCRTPRQFRHTRFTNPALVTFGLCVLSILVIWSLRFLIRDGLVEPGILRNGLESLGLVKSNYWVTAGILIIVNPLAEEYLWRWSVLPVLMDKFQPITAMIITSLLFAGYHPITTMFFFAPIWLLAIFLIVFAGGMFLSWLLLSTHSLKYPIILHLVININLMLLGYLYIK